MSQWKLTNANTSAPIWAPVDIKQAPTRANAIAFYDSGDYDQIGVVSKSNKSLFLNEFGDINMAHTGWVEATYGAGPVVDVQILDSGYGYANGETIIYSVPLSIADQDVMGYANTVITLGVNATGNVISATITEPGSWQGTPYWTEYSGAGQNLNLELKMGGRAGRFTYEVLVAG